MVNEVIKLSGPPHFYYLLASSNCRRLSSSNAGFKGLIRPVGLWHGFGFGSGSGSGSSFGTIRVRK